MLDCWFQQKFFWFTIFIFWENIEPIIKNNQISKEDNFDEDDVVIAKCIGGSGVEEKSSHD